MTTIAWDGRYLAADTRHCSGGAYHYDAPKIVKAGDVFYASTGPSAWFNAWVEWAGAGSNVNDLPVTGLEGHQGGFIRLDAEGCEMLDFRLPYFSPAHAAWAWGSGADFALGAIDAGATAMEAVRAAMSRDMNSGGAVDFVDTQFFGRGVQRWDGLMPSRRFPMPVAEPSAA